MDQWAKHKPLTQPYIRSNISSIFTYVSSIEALAKNDGTVVFSLAMQRSNLCLNHDMELF